MLQGDTGKHFPKPTAGRYLSRVLETAIPAPDHVQISLLAPEIASVARAGQFVHVLCRSEAESADPLLRRAFSIMSVSGDTLKILLRVGGPGTRWLASIVPGELLDILGPLGLPFGTASQIFPATLPHLVLVGGGVGVPPMVALAEQVSRETPDQQRTAIVGARSSKVLLGLAEFKASGTRVLVATEDGSTGFSGLVTGLLQQLLLEAKDATLPSHSPGESGAAPTEARSGGVSVVCCGPLPMLRAVAGLCMQHGVPCQVSLEENMPCGVGVCNGCVIPVLNNLLDGGSDTGASQQDPNLPKTGPEAGYERYRRMCVDGPVMNAYDIDWEATCR